ncbi:MAG: hypothetical protein RIQ33_495, partial [Bacteroidota bacterium]
QFKNNGFSDVYSFTYTEQCKNFPTNIKITQLDKTSLEVTWDRNGGTNFRVQYIEINGGTKKIDVANANSVIIQNLIAGKDYYINVGPECSVGSVQFINDLNKNIYFKMDANPMVNNASENNSGAITPSTVQLTGNVSYAYFNDKEVKGNMGILNKDPDYKDKTSYSYQRDSATIIKALKGAEIALFRKKTSTNLDEFLMLTNAASNGNYTLNFDKALLSTGYTYYLTISNLTTTLEKATIPLTITTNLSFSNAWDIFIGNKTLEYKLGPTKNNAILYTRNIEIKSLINSNNQVAAKNDELAIEYYALKTDYNYTYKLLDEYKNIPGNVESWNGDDYVLIQKVTTADKSIRLLQNCRHLVKVVGKSKRPQYYPLESYNKYVQLERVYNYNYYRNLSGKVLANGNDMPEVAIALTYNIADVEGEKGTSGTRTLYTQSNSDGSYAFINLPDFKDKAKIKIVCSAKSLRSDDFELEYVMNNQINTSDLQSFINSFQKNFKFDIILKNDVSNFIGRLLDTKGNAIANATILVGNEVMQHTTSEKGFYIFQSAVNPTKIIEFNADGYEPIKIAMADFMAKGKNASKYEFKSSDNLFANWMDAVAQSRAVVNYFKTNSNTTPIDGYLFGYSTQSLQDVFKNVNESKDFELKNLYSNDGIKMVSNKKPIDFNIVLDNSKVASTIKIYKLAANAETEVGTFISIANQTFVFEGSAGSYKIKINHVADGVQFVEFENNFNIQNAFNPAITLNLTKGTTYQGTVKSTEGKALADAEISVDGFPFLTKSDGKGFYKITIPATNYFKFKVSRGGYFSKEQIVDVPATTTFDFILEKNKNEIFIKTLSGFVVKIENQKPGSGYTSIISGKLMLAGNEVYKTGNEDEKLTFKDIAVSVDDKGNAVPLSDISFEEAVLQIAAFGYPAEIVGAPQIILSKLVNATDYKAAAIGGSEVVAKLNQVVGGAFTFGEAALVNRAIRTGYNSANYVYITPNTTANELNKDIVLNLEFKNETESHKAYKLFANLNLYLSNTNCSINKNGLSLNGYFKFPSGMPVQKMSKGDWVINKLTLSKELKVVDMDFAVSDKSPFYLSVQKVTAKLNRLSVMGMGTPNIKVGFGGEIWLTSYDTTSKTKNANALIIHKFEIAKLDEGHVTLTGDFELPTTGVNLKSLLITGSRLGFSYNGQENTFEIAASCKLDYADKSNKLAAMLFQKPIDIQTFRLKTKSWAVFLSAKADAQVDLKLIKINLRSFLVNVGYNGISIDQMNDMLLGAKEPPKAIDDGLYYKPLDDGKTNWAIGLDGGVEFAIKKINAGGNASLIFGVINDKFDIRVNEISIGIDNVPTFTLEAKVKLSVGGDSVGFAAAAKLYTLNYGFDAAFHFFKYNNKSGFSLGAQLTADAGKSGIPLGPVPITIFSLGGGFDINSSSDAYRLFVSGMIGIEGVPRETTNLDLEKVELAYAASLEKGEPASFVLSGVAAVNMLKKPLGRMELSIDFIRMQLLVKIDARYAILEGFPAPEIHGLLYGMAPMPYNKNSGAIFLSANATMILYGVMPLNIKAVFGLNYDNDNKYTPQTAKDVFATIPDYVKSGDNKKQLDVIYIDAKLGYDKDIDDSWAGLVGYTAYFKQNVRVNFFYKWKTDEWRIKGTADLAAGGGIWVWFFGRQNIGSVGASLHGELEGGMDKSNDWGLYFCADVNGAVYGNIGKNCDCGGSSHCLEGAIIHEGGRVCAGIGAYVCWSKTHGTSWEMH